MMDNGYPLGAIDQNWEAVRREAILAVHRAAQYLQWKWPYEYFDFEYVHPIGYSWPL